MRTLNTIVRFVITMAKLAPICWAGAKQAASEGREAWQAQGRAQDRYRAAAAREWNRHG